MTIESNKKNGLLLSHPSRVRGLKSFLDPFGNDCFGVAPLAGAWIEMSFPNRSGRFTGSHPSRVRGLKSWLFPG